MHGYILIPLSGRPGCLCNGRGWGWRGGGRIDRFEKIFIPERELPLGVRGAGAAAAPAMALWQVASLRMRPERQKCGMESERVVRGECFVG